MKWLDRNNVTVKTAMDLACGTGVLCRILRDRGIEAAGMDYSAGMIEIARQSGGVAYDVADMVTYRPEKQFDLVTCTGDALNHIMAISDVEAIFENVYGYLAPGGYFIFDLLNENEVSDSQPFEMDFDARTRVWFQMTRPTDWTVNLRIRVFEDGGLQFEENIRETIHDPAVVCGLLEKAGFRDVRCTDRLLADANPGTTWFVTARKPA